MGHWVGIGDYDLSVRNCPVIRSELGGIECRVCTLQETRIQRLHGKRNMSVEMSVISSTRSNEKERAEYASDYGSTNTAPSNTQRMKPYSTQANADAGSTKRPYAPYRPMRKSPRCFLAVGVWGVQSMFTPQYYLFSFTCFSFLLYCREITGMSLPNGLHSLSDSSFPKSVSYEITRGNQLLRKTKRQRQRLVVPDRDPRRGSRIGATALHNHSPSRRAHSLDSSRPFKVFFQKACAFNESPCSLAICWNPF